MKQNGLYCGGKCELEQCVPWQNVDKKNEEVRAAEKRVRLEYTGQEEELRQCKEATGKLKDTIIELKR